MKPVRRSRGAMCVKLARALLCVGAMALIGGSSWNAMAATTPDHSGFLPGGWAVDDALAFDPFNPWSVTTSREATTTTVSGANSGAEPLGSPRGLLRPPPHVPYRPPLRTPYKPPWP